VLNIAGRSVRTLSSDRIAPAGVNTLVWNGENAAGCAVPSGTYLVQLAAASEDGSVSRSVCTVNVNR